MKILITGGTNGIGKGVAQILAETANQSNEIILLGRNKTLCKKVVDELQNMNEKSKVSFVLCDLSKLRDVKNAVTEIRKSHNYLDGVFINAGLGYASSQIETEDGMDAHFQVNYLSQFMLTLNLLELLEKSEKGGRIIFNVTKTKKDKIFWEDLQLKNNWSFETGIHQAMIAKRLFLYKLHRIYNQQNDLNLSFVGFQVHKIVWTNQLNIIPRHMRFMARIMKFLGSFMSMEKCGEIMAPLFTESKEESVKKSGIFYTWKKNEYLRIKEDDYLLSQEAQDKLWNISIDLCADAETLENAKRLI